MIGDNKTIKPQYLVTAQRLLPYLNLQAERLCVAVGGESGCGKTVTALALQHILANQNTTAVILHQDDYFKLPPASNHRNRELDLCNVGTQEVDLKLLQAHINLFLAGATSITKPLVDYNNDSILSENIALHNTKIMIVEGTYSMFLNDNMLKIFIDRTYNDTYLARMARGRDVANEFVEQVLAIEHQIIAPCRSKAAVIIDKNYDIK